MVSAASLTALHASLRSDCEAIMGRLGAVMAEVQRMDAGMSDDEIHEMLFTTWDEDNDGAIRHVRSPAPTRATRAGRPRPLLGQASTHRRLTAPVRVNAPTSHAPRHSASASSREWYGTRTGAPRARLGRGAEGARGRESVVPSIGSVGLTHRRRARDPPAAAPE